MKVKDDHRSKFSNLSNWKEEAWKISGLQRDSNPWPPRYRCDALPTELWSHTLGARSIYWVHIFPCSEVMWSLYEIIHICTAVVDESEAMFVVRFANLSLTRYLTNPRVNAWLPALKGALEPRLLTEILLFWATLILIFVDFAEILAWWSWIVKKYIVLLPTCCSY